MFRNKMSKSVSNLTSEAKARREREKYLTTAAYPVGIIAEVLGLIYNNQFQYEGSGINDLINSVEEKVAAEDDKNLNELIKVAKSRMKEQKVSYEQFLSKFWIGVAEYRMMSGDTERRWCFVTIDGFGNKKQTTTCFIKTA